MDENIFFRNATLEICSSLEIEKALWKCLWFMQEGIPVAQMSLHLYDAATGIAETIAHATLDDYRVISSKVLLIEQTRRQIEMQRTIRVRMVSDTADDPVTEPLCRYLGCLERSALIMDLVIEGKFLGVLSFQSFPDEQFNESHRQMVSLLNEPFAIAVSNSIRYRQLKHLKDMLEDDNQYFQKELQLNRGEVIGAEFGLKNTMEYVRQVSPTDSPVLLLGETGVGKELIATAIHNLSHRREGPFIAVNCGAIPESLMDSELFGHEKGAFTGAIAQKRGRFERANGGTLFLDEIGELNPDAQVKLLRVLQEKILERLGGTESIKLDIRVIAATHRDLDDMMAKDLFRQDLYFRLKVFPIVIPPLRYRLADIPSLVHHFIQKKSTQMKLHFMPRLAPDAMEHLMQYSWPGNIRELENTVERALILSHGAPLNFRELVFANAPEKRPSTPEIEMPKIIEDDFHSLDNVMVEHIKAALYKSGGKVEGKGAAADLLNINPRTLRHRMRKLGVPFGRSAQDLYIKKED
ncbi:Transcriptional regulator containing GAF, AAA-type ATPase, and DNA-binding Fis domains [Desulfocicer vacuolatum DSM 3385]|uniref:Transcriptional regulator containing GAF, AAA-type ATPase, and DNA-binding Fis domains n=1 Tax=Desulfocicer vacuolatum DSM 3385 TaxID=1121400 RepID=A0A1W2EKU1_9BACT|nr:sigma 54-interacting transcriptional regulator [Desulfocicer vacuolatum]SMD09768.1 Transcriptional regulator containing GAF, AAA-type ATPase, and DNA-binding Fis domains [Desulfocicer vacuolatum DSM 3385]